MTRGRKQQAQREKRRTGGLFSSAVVIWMGSQTNPAEDRLVAQRGLARHRGVADSSPVLGDKACASAQCSPRLDAGGEAMRPEVPSITAPARPQPQRVDAHDSSGRPAETRPCLHHSD